VQLESLKIKTAIRIDGGSQEAGTVWRLKNSSGFDLVELGLIV
jgi:hypothetical protein